MWLSSWEMILKIAYFVTVKIKFIKWILTTWKKKNTTFLHKLFETQYNIVVNIFFLCHKKSTYTSIPRQLICLILWRSRFDNKSPLGFDLLAVVACFPVVPPCSRSVPRTHLLPYPLPRNIIVPGVGDLTHGSHAVEAKGDLVL